MKESLDSESNVEFIRSYDMSLPVTARHELVRSEFVLNLKAKR